MKNNKPVPAKNTTPAFFNVPDMNPNPAAGSTLISEQDQRRAEAKQAKRLGR